MLKATKGLQRKSPLKGRTFVCSCGKSFYIPPSRINGKPKFCSRQCSSKRYLTNEPSLCAFCGTEFYCSKSQQKYRNRKHCSVKCMGLANTKRAEERNAINPPSTGVLNRRLRYSKKANEWRKAVFERDDYTCQFCGARNGMGKRIVLEADHIKPWAYFHELRFEISNGRTLCKPCHKTTETFGSGAKKYATEITA